MNSTGNMQPEPTILAEAECSTISEFCAELCRGNAKAMEFCHLWFNYCHKIDDLIDIGPPVVSNEQILELFIMANVLYSHEFYVAHKSVLQPVVMLVTNAYADTVPWEKSTVNRQRMMADVLRCCGNEMFFAVAIICGGWQHLRSLSARLRERSWQLQHDEHDNPN